MKTIDCASLRERLDEHLATVASGEPLRVRRPAGSVVVVREADYNGLLETLHLIANPTNAARLRAAIAQLNAGIDVDGTR